MWNGKAFGHSSLVAEETCVMENWWCKKTTKMEMTILCKWCGNFCPNSTSWDGKSGISPKAVRSFRKIFVRFDPRVLFVFQAVKPKFLIGKRHSFHPIHLWKPWNMSKFEFDVEPEIKVRQDCGLCLSFVDSKCFGLLTIFEGLPRTTNQFQLIPRWGYLKGHCVNKTISYHAIKTKENKNTEMFLNAWLLVIVCLLAGFLAGRMEVENWSSRWGLIRMGVGAAQ